MKPRYFQAADLMASFAFITIKGVSMMRRNNRDGAGGSSFKVLPCWRNDIPYVPQLDISKRQKAHKDITVNHSLIPFSASAL